MLTPIDTQGGTLTNTWTNRTTSNDQPDYAGNLTFDTQTPYDSISTFCNRHQCLNPKEKKTFITQLFDFFTECGDYDRERRIPDNLKERFAKVYLPTLLQVMDSPDVEKQRLVALIEKVGIWRFFLEVPRKYRIVQIFTEQNTCKPESSLSLHFWGWNHYEAPLPKCRPPKVSSPEEIDGDAPSRWFDSKNAFDSIARFTRRFSALSQEEQKKTFGAITHFFRSCAFQGYKILISDDQAKNFAGNDLPFLLSWYRDGNLNGSSVTASKTGLQQSEATRFKKHQLLASIQQVTEKRFISIEEEDQLYQILFDQGDEASQNSTKQGFSWLKQPWASSSMKLRQMEVDSVKKERGYTEDDTLKAPFDPLIALALQKFQYPHVFELDTHSESSLRSAIRLLVWAERSDVVELKTAIAEWLNSKEIAKPELAQVCTSLLSQPGVSKALINANLGPLVLKDDSANEKDIVCLLDYNRNWWTSNQWDWLSHTFGKNPSKQPERKLDLNNAQRKALVTYQQDLYGEQLLYVDYTLYLDYLTSILKKFSFHAAKGVPGRFLTDALFKLSFGGEDYKLLDCLSESYDFLSGCSCRQADSLDVKELKKQSERLSQKDLEEMIQFLQNQEVVEYFTIRGTAKTVEKLLEFLKTTLQPHLRMEQFTKELISVKPAEVTSLAIGTLASAPISKIIEQIEQRYESASKKVTALILTCVGESWESSGLEALILQGSNKEKEERGLSGFSFWCKYYRNWALTRNKAASALSLLEKPEIAAFLKKNEFDTDRIIVLLRYFICESEIMEYCQAFADHMRSSSDVIDNFDVFKKPLLASLNDDFSFIGGARYLEGVIAREEAFLKKLRKLTYLPDKIKDSGTDATVFTPKEVRYHLIQTFSYCLLNNKIDQIFTDPDRRKEIRKYVEWLISTNATFDAGSRISDGQDPLTTAEAGKLAQLLSVNDELNAKLPEEMAQSAYRNRKLQEALQTYSKSVWGGWWG